MTTVRDIMQADVITTRADTTVRELVQLLDEEGVSGVPVLGATGKVCGVVSRTDVIRAAARTPEVPVAEAFWEGVGRESEDDPEVYFVAPESASALLTAPGMFESLMLDEMTVDQVMTPVAFSVDPGMTVVDIARFLVQGRIHRALVVENERLAGIVTAFDVLRAVAGDEPD